MGSRTSDLLQSYKSVDSLTINVIYEFQKEIHKNRFFNNKEYLKGNSSRIKFDKKRWFLRPETFCHDYYGSSELFHIILLVNDISSRFNFRESNFKKGIYAPSIESIRTVLSQNIS